MSFVSNLTAFVSYMGSFPARAFSPEAKDAKHDFECSRGVSSPPLVDISPGDNDCANCSHTEGSLHVCEDWILVPDNEQQEPCLCCAFVEGVPSKCLNRLKQQEQCLCCAFVEGVPSKCLNRPTQQAPCLCCAFVEGVPSKCLNRRNDSSDSSDSDDE